MMYCEVPSTNNDTENFIRRYIMQRNVRGQMKSNQGMRMSQSMLERQRPWRITEHVLGDYVKLNWETKFD